MGFLIKKLMHYFTALTAAQPHRSSFSFHGCWMCSECSWHLLPFQHYKASSCERFVSNSNAKCPLCAQTEGAIDTHGSCEGIFTNISIDFQFMPQSSLERARWFSKQITRTSTQPCLVGGFFFWAGFRSEREFGWKFSVQVQRPLYADGFVKRLCAWWHVRE